MNGEPVALTCLLVEDDEEILKEISENLPKELAGFQLEYETCSSFDEALQMVKRHRYDMVITDVYRDRKDRRKGIDPADAAAGDIVNEIRAMRFCPVIIFSDGSVPPTIKIGPFVQFADKSLGTRDIVAKLKELLQTGLPAVARNLHEELDRTSSNYLWGFLEDNWLVLQREHSATPDVVERLVKRRAAVQLARLDPSSTDPKEMDQVEGLEFYIAPPIAGGEFRLGSIIRQRESSELRVVLTPHCYLTKQPKATAPRAEYILAGRIVPASELIEKYPYKATKVEKRREEIRQRTQSPTNLGSPEGRYWFLPRLLDLIPEHCYCDFFQLESISYADLVEKYEQIAVLESPFAEGLQSCFIGFYASVGLPSLNLARFTEWTLAAEPAAAEPAAGAGQSSQSRDEIASKATTPPGKRVALPPQPKSSRNRADKPATNDRNS